MQSVVAGISREKRTLDASHARTQVLLACGILSSLVYVAANFACAVVWKDYSSFSQTISELSAIGAPSRSTWIPFGIAYGVLLLAFGIGVWRSALGRRRLRVTAAFVMGIGANLYWAPMNLRGHPPTLSDTAHIVTGAVTSVAILLAVGSGASAFGRWFRLYSIATIAVLLAAGFATFMYAPRLAANLPTPGMGLIERIDLGAWLLWVAVLAVVLFSDRTREPACLFPVRLRRT